MRITARRSSDVLMVQNLRDPATPLSGGDPHAPGPQ
ncbi:hypothetical protein [Streptomyces sp. NPDC049970]